MQIGKTSPRQLASRYFINCVATHFSMIFETKRRLEIGLKFLNSSGDKVDILNSGLTMASLSTVGISPVSKEMLTT